MVMSFKFRCKREVVDIKECSCSFLATVFVPTANRMEPWIYIA